MPKQMPSADRRAILAAAMVAVALPWGSTARAAAAPDGSLHVVAELVARPGQEAALRGALTAFVPMARAEPGCLDYRLFEDRKQPGRFLTEEIWSGEAALAAHFQTPRMKAVAPQLAQMLAKPLMLTEMTRLA